MPIDVDQAKEEFSYLKVQEATRNSEYYLLRQAVKGNFRWPRDWPRHIPKMVFNVCKPITERFATYLMGKSFTWNIERPNTLEYRDAAESSEKILKRLLDLSKSELQFDLGAKTGSELGRTIFKVYKKGAAGAEHACFTYCQPDYFYGIAAGDDHVSDFSVVYYSYPLDKFEAKRVFGPGDYKTQDELDRHGYYDQLPEQAKQDQRLNSRKVPVLEVWTKDNYLLMVGGVEKYNGENPNKRASDGEGFIPFVVIENIARAGETRGEADIAQTRELNEAYNRLISRKNHVVGRWLNPTIFWEGAPSNYGEVLAQTLAGGGAIPGRLGSRISFLTYDKPNPAVVELEASMRAAMLESAGMSEIALQGTVQGSINTGPALAAQFQPVISTIEKKRQAWVYGLRTLFAMLLEVQESIGDSTALGLAVINESQKSAEQSDGELVELSGSMIQGLRDVTISWPGVLPKDDYEATRLEMEKTSQGMQSIYTFMENTGVEYPADEIARIRMENQDPSLRGEKVAEQMRSAAPMMKVQADAAAAQQQAAAGDPNQAAPYDPNTDPNADTSGGSPHEPGIGDMLRQLQARRPQMDMSAEDPTIGYPGAADPSAA